MTKPNDPLGLIAGQGDLPARVVDRCLVAGRPVCVVGFDGQTDFSRIPGSVPLLKTRLGAVGQIIDWFKENGVRDLVLAGGIKRPSFLSVCPDARGAQFIARVGLKALGDDGLLRAVIAELESDGFRVLGVHDILGDRALASAGVWGDIVPDEQAESDIKRALDVARALGAADVGQAVVVQQGLVLGVEALEGTDALLRRCRDLKREGPGGVLVKICKPGQDDRADMPTIGVSTVQGIFDSGLRGMAVSSGRTVVVDRGKMIQLANSLGVFLTGIET
jgi:DUF1009 family protein